MQFPFYIAKRYFVSKHGKNAINIINWLSFSITVISATVLFVVLSGFAGLKKISLQHLSFFDPDLKIEAKTGKTLEFNENTEEELKQISEIVFYSKIIEERVYLEYNKKSELAFIKGVDSNYGNVVILDSIIAYGDWFKPNINQAVIGAGISNKLTLGIHDFDNPLKIIVPKPGKGQISSVKSAYNSTNLVPFGIYQINEDIDKKYVFTNLNVVQDLLNYDKSTLTGVELKVESDSDYEALKSKIKGVFKNEVIVKDKFQLNDALYKMLNTENIALYLIGTLVVIIALFNVVGSIIMMILDKKSNLKTMFAMGATLSDIRNIFFYQGVIMTILGSVIGIIIGFVLVIIQEQFELVMIGSQPWPLVVAFSTIMIVLVTISTLGVIASKIASSRINMKLITS